MRPFEILLLLAEFSVLVLMFLPISRSQISLRFLQIVAVLVAVAQLLIEGPRWQMVPAYLMIGLFFPIWRSQKFVFMLGSLALFASLLLSMAIPVFQFAKPTGP